MKLTEILGRDRPSISFEVFPPKANTAFESVQRAAEQIAALHPAFMSVTYGAGGGTSAYTLEIARSIRARCGVEMVAHLTCVSSTRKTVRARIEAMHEAGVENVLALRGDLPAELAGADRSAWPYRYATDLIGDLRASGYGFCIGAACYPEVHPESANQREDIRRLKEKVDAGCSFLTTQMFFDNGLLYNFLYKIREAGITVPVIAGIMPITSATQIERAIRLSGSHMPRRFISLVDRFGGDAATMKQAGIAYATAQIIDLFANGVNNVHVYSMNRPDVARSIRDNLSAILGA